MKAKVNLRRSVFNAARTRKSCPRCSARAGRLVFKAYPRSFGTSDARSGEGAQSWCTTCRAEARRRAA